MLLGGAAGQVDLDWLEHLAAPEPRPGCTTAKEDLVNVVVQDHTDVIKVVTTEAHAHVLRNAVTDGVRVPGPLALDDLDRL